MSRASIKNAFNGVALLVIDVQKQFCDPSTSQRGSFETNMIAKRIAQLAPEFRKAGIPVYAVHFGLPADNASEVDFHQFKPAAEDTLISKLSNSAFGRRGNQTAKKLHADGRQTLLVCGFNLSGCVKETVLDARRAGFDVRLLTDICGNDNSNRRCDPEADVADMVKKGAIVDSAERLLKTLKP